MLNPLMAIFKILFLLSLLFVSGYATLPFPFSFLPLPFPGSLDDGDRLAVKTNYNGEWELFSQNSGVSAMHSVLLPNNKVVMYDATIWKISRIKLPAGATCRVVDEATGEKDCWCHSVFFDIETGELTPLTVCFIPCHILFLILASEICFFKTISKYNFKILIRWYLSNN